MSNLIAEGRTLSWRKNIIYGALLKTWQQGRSSRGCGSVTPPTLSNLVRKFRPRLHRNGSMCNRTRTVRIGLAFTRELMEPFHTEPFLTRQGEIRLRIADDYWIIYSRRKFCVRLRTTNVWWETFFKNFSCS